MNKDKVIVELENLTVTYLLLNFLLQKLKIRDRIQYDKTYFEDSIARLENQSSIIDKLLYQNKELQLIKQSAKTIIND